MKYGITVTSPAFINGEKIPSKYTCDGSNISPPLNIHGLPDETKSLVLMIEDPDAPMGVWDHWIVWNILPSTQIMEDSIPGIEGMNSFKRNHYGGPCPPSGIHRYFFKVFALNTFLELDATSRKDSLEKAMKKHILAHGELVGVYSRKQ